MNISIVSKTKTKDTPHNVDAREIYNLDNAQVVHIELKPNEGLKPHKTPVDVFFYVLEGTVEVNIGGEVQLVDKDSIVESPKNITHYFINKSNVNARVLVVKAPNPNFI